MTRMTVGGEEVDPTQVRSGRDPLGPLSLLRPSSDGRPLTHAEVLGFRYMGYVRAPNVIPSDWVERMRRTVESYFENADPPLYTTDTGEVRRINSLLERDPLFAEVLALGVVAEPVKSLLGPGVELLLNRHNFAARNAPGDFTYGLHRDALQWSRGMLTVLIYLEEATSERGATQVVPGSHLLPFPDEPDAPVRGQLSTWAAAHAQYDHVRRQALPVPMPAGGILLIDSLLFHSVGISETPGTRLSLSFACHSVDENRDTVRGERLQLYGKRDA